MSKSPACIGTRSPNSDATAGSISQFVRFLLGTKTLAPLPDNQGPSFKLVDSQTTSSRFAPISLRNACANPFAAEKPPQLQHTPKQPLLHY